MLTVRVDFKGFAEASKALAGLRQDVRDRAVVAALNKTADKARVEMRRGITDAFAIKAGDVNSRLSVRPASFRGGVSLTAVLEALPGSRRGRSMNVIHFLRRAVTRQQARKGKQLGFRFKRGGPIKEIPGAFVGNSGRTVFVREGTSRKPIRPKQVIDIPSMFNTRRINARVVAKIQADFPVEFERAARVMLSRFAAAK